LEWPSLRWGLSFGPKPLYLGDAAGKPLEGNVKPVTDVGFNAVRNALIESGAKLIGRGEGPNGSGLSWHTLNGNVVIFQAYANNEGCEVYRPVFDGLSVEATIDAMLKYLHGKRPVVRMKEPEQQAAERLRIGNTPTCDECGEQHSQEQSCEEASFEAAQVNMREQSTADNAQ
jgi:hypothetical protein